MLYDILLPFGRLSCTDPGPRRPPAAAHTDPLATLTDPSLSYRHVKAKNEIVPQRELIATINLIKSQPTS